MDPLLITIEDSAKLLAVSVRQAYYLAASGALPTVRLGNKRRVPVRLLQELIDLLESQPEAQTPLQLLRKLSAQAKATRG